MPDVMANANAWLQGQRHEKLSSAIVYRRGAQDLALSATIGRTLFESETVAGTRLVTESRDYLVRTSDLLALATGTKLPQIGDQIRETQGAVVYSYEVMPFGPQDEHWRYSDPQRLAVRIHTKLLGDEAV